MYTRINRKTARKLYDNGMTIYLLPSKAAIGSIWICPLPISGQSDFDKKVNAYQYYNCNKEVGKRVHYYVYSENWEG